MWYIVIFVLTLRDSWLPCSALDYLFYLGEEIAQLDFNFNQLANGCLLLYALKVSLRTCLLKGFLRECAFFFFLSHLKVALLKASINCFPLCI